MAETDPGIQRLTTAYAQLEVMAANCVKNIAEMPMSVISQDVINSIVKSAIYDTFSGKEPEDGPSMEELQEEHDTKMKTMADELGDAYATTYRTCHYGELYLLYMQMKLSGSKAFKAAHMMDNMLESEVFDMKYTPDHFGCITIEYFAKFKRLLDTMFELAKLSDAMINRIVPSID